MRKLLIVLAAALLLAGCATGYGYSSHDRGYGDYYYGGGSSYGAYGDYGDYYYSPYGYPGYGHGYGYGGFGHYSGLGLYGGWHGLYGHPWYGGSYWYGRPIYVYRPPYRPRPPKDPDPDDFTPPPMSDPVPPNRLRVGGEPLGGERTLVRREVVPGQGGDTVPRSRVPNRTRPAEAAPPRGGNLPASPVPRSRALPPDSRLRVRNPSMTDGRSRAPLPASSPRPRMSAPSPATTIRPAPPSRVAPARPAPPRAAPVSRRPQIPAQAPRAAPPRSTPAPRVAPPRSSPAPRMRSRGEQEE